MSLCFKNAAGDKHCDSYLRDELELAGINVIELPEVIRGEVPSKLAGELHGWKFERAWYYWTAHSPDGPPLLFRYADPLNEKYGKDVRVAGMAGGCDPHYWYEHSRCTGVDCYHIDTMIGLKVLADAIKLQATEEGKE